MTEFLEIVKKVEAHEELQEWLKNHPEYFLAHGFKVADEEWQVGYSDGEKVMTVMQPFNIVESDEVAKRPDTKVKELKKENITLSLEEAHAVFEKLRNEKYANETIFKEIILIQNLDETIYNITAMTQSLKTLNVKVSMKGEVLEDSCEALISN